MSIVAKRSPISATAEHLLRIIETRMWANAQRDGGPAEYRWRPALNAAKFGSRPLLECRAVTLLIGERKTWRTQSEFCTWQNSVTGKSRWKCIHSLPAQGIDT